MPQKTVFRVVRRRAKSGCAPAYEALVRAMFEQARGFSGYLSADLIPPEAEGGEYQILQRFATEADLARWQASDERAGWMEKLSHVAEGDPEYRLLHGLEAWFSPAPQPAPLAPPIRWRMTAVSWLGIFPTVAVLLTFVAPLLDFLPFLARTAVITALVAVLMAYVVMPRLTRWLGRWVRG